MEKPIVDTSRRSMTDAVEANVYSMAPLFQRWPRAEVHIKPDLIWSLTDIPIALFNSVLRARLTPEAADRAIADSIERGRSRNVPMLWWTGPSSQPADLEQRLAAHGFEKEESPGMAVDIESLPESISVPGGFRIEQVQDTEALAHWSRVMGIGFEMPEFAVEAFQDFSNVMLTDSESSYINYLGWLEEEAVATTSLIFGAGVAGIYNVATIPSARRKGIGAAMTHHALLEARALGYRIGVLVSTEMGLNVYRGLGFEKYCTLGQHIWSGASPES